MFRRFGIKDASDNESEILINLRQITRIEKVGGITCIYVSDRHGPFWSTVEYKHLADALDGLIFD